MFYNNKQFFSNKTLFPLICPRTSKVPDHCDHTPPNATSSGDTKLLERGQGDGLHNNCVELSLSPVKKLRMQNEQRLPVKYVVADGFLEFKGKVCKKLQRETRWSRPCKLQIAYTQSGLEDCTMLLIIYEGNMKCRRNLMKDFDVNTSE